MILQSPQGTSGTLPAPGTIVSVPFLLFFRHVGIVSDRWHDGAPMVIANAPSQGVREVPLTDFADGQEVRVEGYPGPLPPGAVLARARALIETPYQTLSWNCEHFVAHVHGLPPNSPQAAAAVTLLLVGGVMLAARRR